MHYFGRTRDSLDNRIYIGGTVALSAVDTK